MKIFLFLFFIEILKYRRYMVTRIHCQLVVQFQHYLVHFLSKNAHVVELVIELNCEFDMVQKHIL